MTIDVVPESAPNGQLTWVVRVDGACVGRARSRAAAQRIADTQAMLIDQQLRLRERQS